MCSVHASVWHCTASHKENLLLAVHRYTSAGRSDHFIAAKFLALYVAHYLNH